MSSTFVSRFFLSSLARVAKKARRGMKTRMEIPTLYGGRGSRVCSFPTDFFISYFFITGPGACCQSGESTVDGRGSRRGPLAERPRLGERPAGTDFRRTALHRGCGTTPNASSSPALRVLVPPLLPVEIFPFRRERLYVYTYCLQLNNIT